MKLYAFQMSPNSRRVQLALEELGVQYEYVNVDLSKAEQKAESYVALNPNARVPTLVDGDFVLWESHAINEYLAGKYPEKRLGGESPAERGEIAKWCFLNAAHFGPANAKVFQHTMRLPEDQRLPRLVEEGRTEGNRVLALLDQALAGKEWLVGGRITLADIALVPTVAFTPMLGFDLSKLANVNAWLARIKARPAAKKMFM
jgi:glutathione S-transferase